MVEKEPKREILDEEIRFNGRETTGFEEIKGVISFDDAWRRELKHPNWTQSQSPRPPVSSGLPSSAAQELPMESNAGGGKRRAPFPDPPPPKKAFPPIGGEFRNRATPFRIASLRQHNSLPTWPKEGRSLNFYHQQHPATKTSCQNPLPRQLPDIQNNLQSSLTPGPSLPSPSLHKPSPPLPKLQETSTAGLMPEHSHDRQISLLSQKVHLWCDLCEVPCMGAFNYDQHCQGKKHKAKWEEAFGNRQEIEMKKPKSLWCEKCGVPCVNEFALAQHRAGKKHVLRLVELQVLKDGSPEVAKLSEPKPRLA